MAKLVIRMLPPHDKVGSVKVSRFTKGMSKNLRLGLTEAGAVVQKQWLRNISGTGYTKNPGRSKPFPGHLTGQYARTLRVRIFSNGKAVHIGPNVNYAIYHETGTKHMPARPVVKPTMDKVGRQAFKVLNRRIIGPLRK